MTRPAVRPWCAVARYPGLQSFLGGTITIDADAASHEIEAEMRTHFLTFLPPGFEIEDLRCGALFFKPDE